MFPYTEKSLLTTKLGIVQGKHVQSCDGTRYLAFHNIPYAETPTGKLRFKAPQPVHPWNGVLDATVEGSECYSKHQFYLNRIGSEDCLKLNIYTRSTNIKQSVMVFIHGGGFVMGSSNTEMYGPDYFMREDIVLVTINYRLGIFGFLAFEDKALGVPGNAGLKDQIMALAWIQENITCFGGDPANVTIFGASAGSASINYLLCSPMSEGLFHKVIMQSGSALNPWARGRGLPKEILKYFNLTGKSEDSILTKLQRCTKEELLDAQSACIDPLGACDLEAFGPVIEGYNPFEASLLLDDPLAIMHSGNYIKVPMIIGYNAHEGLLFDAMEVKYNVDFAIKNFKNTVPWFYNLSTKGDLLNKIAYKIKEYYFKTNDPALPQSRNQYTDMQTDIFFLRGIYVTLRTILQTNTCPIYLYRFDFDGKLNGYKHLFKVTRQGTCHGDDCFYIFKTTILHSVEEDSIEMKTIRRLVKMWSHFANTSDPNPSANQELFNVHWPITNGKQLLNIATMLQVIPFPESNRMQFWNELDSVAKM